MESHYNIKEIVKDYKKLVEYKQWAWIKQIQDSRLFSNNLCPKLLKVLWVKKKKIE